VQPVRDLIEAVEDRQKVAAGNEPFSGFGAVDS
jgi:hypothetical protein